MKKQEQCNMKKKRKMNNRHCVIDRREPMDVAEDDATGQTMIDL